MGTERKTDSSAGARTSARAHHAILGSIASSAPRAALLRALRRLRPQCAIRLQPCGSRGGRQLYRVELQNPMDDRANGGGIDAWLRVKSALMAEFPADKPHAVTPLDP